jgi:hypothetical protein
VSVSSPEDRADLPARAALVVLLGLAAWGLYSFFTEVVLR